MTALAIFLTLALLAGFTACMAALLDHLNNQ